MHEPVRADGIKKNHRKKTSRDDSSLIAIQNLESKISDEKIQLVLSDPNSGANDLSTTRAIKLLHNSLASQQASLSATNPRLSLITGNSAKNMADIQRMLDPDLTLVEYYIADDMLNTWVISPSDTAFFQQKVDRSELYHHIHSLVTAIVLRIDELEEIRSRSLYDLLIQPVAHKLNTKSVCIVPHLGLHHLPFHALKHEKGYFIEDHSIFYLPAASLLSFFRKEKAKALESVLVMANPDLGAPSYSLPFAEIEGQNVAKAFNTSKILSGKKASKQMLLQHIHEYDMVHLAVHGTFDPENPLQSKLLLAGSLDNNDSLQAAEVFNLDLSGLNVVTLSACDTSRSKITTADELLGFNRAFIAAGAQTVISSLWLVDDAGTSQLMTQFYQNLVRFNTIDAIRMSQLALIKSEKYKRPYYWAPFIVVGNYI